MFRAQFSRHGAGGGRVGSASADDADPDPLTAAGPTIPSTSGCKIVTAVDGMSDIAAANAAAAGVDCAALLGASSGHGCNWFRHACRLGDIMSDSGYGVNEYQQQHHTSYFANMSKNGPQHYRRPHPHLHRPDQQSQSSQLDISHTTTANQSPHQQLAQHPLLMDSLIAAQQTYAALPSSSQSSPPLPPPSSSSPACCDGGGSSQITNSYNARQLFQRQQRAQQPSLPPYSIIGIFNTFLILHIYVCRRSIRSYTHDEYTHTYTPAK